MFPEGHLPISYLGLPLFSTRLMMENCHHILNVIRKSLTAWKALLLSSAVRLEFIKSTLASLNIYWASYFLLPMACIQLIEKHIRNFYCGSFDEKRKMHTIAWSKLCLPMEQGGLGIRSISSTAKAAHKRRVWFIASQQKILVGKMGSQEIYQNQIILGHQSKL